MNNTINFLDFPQDVQFYTLEYLQMDDLLKLRITNTKCRDLFQRVVCHILEVQTYLLESPEGRMVLKNRQIAVFHKGILSCFSRFYLLENVLREINGFFQKNSGSSRSLIEETTINFILQKYLGFPLLRQDGNKLQYFPEELRMDREIVLTAVSQSGLALLYADDSLKADKEIVYAALKQDGSALGVASDKFKKDPEAAMLAIKENFWAFDHVDISLKQDRDFVLEAIRINIWIYDFVKEFFRNDPEIHLVVMHAKKTRSIPKAAFSDQKILHV